jgi:hypothetical protein
MEELTNMAQLGNLLWGALALLLVSASPVVSAAQSRQIVNLTAPTTFLLYGSNGAPASSDVSGCGYPGNTPCSTCNFLWSELVNWYDLKGFQVMVQFSGNTHTDGCQLTGRPLGQVTPRQIEFIGIMSNPDAVLLDPQNGGDAFSVAFDAEVAIGGFMGRNNGTGQGVFVSGQGGRLLGLGQLVSLGSPSHPSAMNDYTAGGLGALVELATPDTSADSFGVEATGSYWFDGPGQCAFDAGSGGFILGDNNGQPGVFNFFWSGQSYTVATVCANNGGRIQLENISQHGTISGQVYNYKTDGHIDALVTGMPGSGGTGAADPGYVQ